MNRTSLCMLAIAAFSLTPVFCQYESIGARSSAMGDASVSITDTWAAYNNPSALGFTDKIQWGVSYKNNFLVKELNQVSLAFALPVKKVGVFHATANRFGFDLYSFNTFGLGYSRKLGKLFALGVTLNLHWIHMGDIYGDKVTASGCVSFTIKPMKNWVIGGNVYNLNATPLSADGRERINTVFRLGTAYLVAQKLLISIEGEASIQYDPTFKAGLEYKPVSLLAIRAGLLTYPLGPTFGFGIQYKNFMFDFAGKWNPVLGFSPVAALAYSFGK